MKFIIKNTKYPLHFAHDKYRPDIDGLRAIAVLSVVIFHAFPEMLGGGFIGVDIFFVISGFLISKIIFESLERGSFSFAEFYARRIKRIFPALFVVLVFSYILGWFSLFSDEYKQLGKHIAAGAGFSSNFILWDEVNYFDNAAETKPLLHLWSLGIEEQFYIAWPLLLWAGWKRNVNFLIIIVSLFCVSIYLNIKGVGTNLTATFYSPQTRIWELLSGSFLAYIDVYKVSIKKLSNLFRKISVNNQQTNLINHHVSSWRIMFSFAETSFSPTLHHKCRRIFSQIFTNNILSTFGLVLFFYGLYRIHKNINFPGVWAIIPVASAVLIIRAGKEAWINKKLLSNRIIVWFGLISFPLYLWHWSLLSFIRIFEGGTPSRIIRLMAVLVSIVLSWIVYRFIEQPIRFSGVNHKMKTIVLFISMVFIGCVGYITYYFDGYELRESIKGYVNNKNELIRAPATDEQCLQYIGDNKPSFPYCRFTNGGGQKRLRLLEIAMRT